MASSDSTGASPITEQAEYAYDEVPYRGYPRMDTHPDGLATRARLFGIESPDIEKARILEIGCGDGGNLISIAQTLPESTCLGIDLSQTQIEMGEDLAKSLSLKNLRLEQGGADQLLDRDETWDYIICHGVYSWVTPEVQDQILEVIRRSLAPEGVAFVSYNCYPGWRLREITRELMLFHSEKVEELGDKVTASRQIVDGLIQSIPGYLPGYANFLKDEKKLLDQCQDFYIAHEHLEGENNPFYFREFAGQLDGKQLQFLCEANLSTMYINRVPPEIGQWIDPNASVVEIEQYLDFIQMRMFRQTLICHADAEVSRQLDPSRTRSLFASAYGVFDAGGPPPITDQPESYQGSRGANLTTALPIAKAALQVMALAWPARLGFDDVVKGARERLAEAGISSNQSPEEEETALAETLLAGATADILDLHVSEGAYTCELGDKPVASPLARKQAEQGERVPTLRHTVANFDQLGLQLIGQMDGEHDRGAMVEAALKSAETMGLQFRERGVLVTDPARIRQLIEAEVDARLAEIARSALLCR